MACGCKGRSSASGTMTASAGTFRVMVSERQVYESSNVDAATTVGGRFQSAEILTPTGGTLVRDKTGTWVDKLSDTTA